MNIPPGNVQTSYNGTVANVMSGPTPQLTMNAALADYLADAIDYNRNRMRMMHQRNDQEYQEARDRQMMPQQGATERMGRGSGIDTTPPGVPMFIRHLSGFNMYGQTKAKPGEAGAVFAGYGPAAYAKSITGG